MFRLVPQRRFIHSRLGWIAALGIAFACKSAQEKLDEEVMGPPDSRTSNVHVERVDFAETARNNWRQTAWDEKLGITLITWTRSGKQLFTLAGGQAVVLPRLPEGCQPDELHSSGREVFVTALCANSLRYLRPEPDGQWHGWSLPAPVTVEGKAKQQEETVRDRAYGNSVCELRSDTSYAKQTRTSGVSVLEPRRDREILWCTKEAEPSPSKRTLPLIDPKNVEPPNGHIFFSSNGEVLVYREGHDDRGDARVCLHMEPNGIGGCATLTEVIGSEWNAKTYDFTERPKGAVMWRVVEEDQRFVPTEPGRFASIHHDTLRRWELKTGAADLEVTRSAEVSVPDGFSFNSFHRLGQKLYFSASTRRECRVYALDEGQTARLVARLPSLDPEEYCPAFVPGDAKLYALLWAEEHQLALFTVELGAR